MFQRHVKNIAIFPHVRMRTNAFREETTADHEVEEYKKYIARLLEEFQARFDHLQE